MDVETMKATMIEQLNERYQIMQNITIKEFTRRVQDGVIEEWKTHLLKQGIEFEISCVNDDSIHPQGFVYLKPLRSSCPGIPLLLDYVKIHYSFKHATVETANSAVTYICTLIQKLHADKWITENDCLQIGDV